MALPQIIQGTWEQLANRADELRQYKNLLLIIPAEEATHNETVSASKTERIEAIRAGMGKFAHLGPAVEELHRDRQEDKRKEEQQIEALQP